MLADIIFNKMKVLRIVDGEFYFLLKNTLELFLWSSLYILEQTGLKFPRPNPLLTLTFCIFNCGRRVKLGRLDELLSSIKLNVRGSTLTEPDLTFCTYLHILIDSSFSSFLQRAGGVLTYSVALPPFF